MIAMTSLLLGAALALCAFGVVVLVPIVLLGMVVVSLKMLEQTLGLGNAISTIIGFTLWLEIGYLGGALLGSFGIARHVVTQSQPPLPGSTRM